MLAIDNARPDEWTAALSLACRHLGGEERRLRVVHLLHLIDEGALDPRGLLVARDRVGLAGVQVCIPLGGAGCLFWPPEVREGLDTGDLKDRLVRAGFDWCRAAGYRLAQALLAPREAGRAAALVRQGFALVTRLHYLHHDLDDVEADEPADIDFEAFSPANDALFRATLERTYEGTLDCPELNGVRTVDEVLEGYRTSSASRPGRWWLVRTGDAPAGVVILSELPEGPAWELSYLGVVPERRRQGVGRAAVLRALRAARADRAGQMLITVDERNAPARRLYQGVGCVEGEVREVYLQILPPVTPR